jgi:hypothetical protein
MLDMLLLPENVPENVGILQEVLKYHILDGAIPTADMVDGEYETLQGSDVAVEVSSDGAVKVNFAEVIYPDISASNGIVHLIDAVLLPPAEEVPAPGPAATSDPTVAVVVVDDDDGPGPVERLVSAQFLEMDASPDMNIINQDDSHINIPQDNPGEEVGDLTLTYTSVSASLDPHVLLDDQPDRLPGGVILILVGRTPSGEIVRNRLMWTYTMGCGGGDVVTVEAGEGLGWTIFVSFVVDVCCLRSAVSESDRCTNPRLLPFTISFTDTHPHHTNSASFVPSPPHPCAGNQDELEPARAEFCPALQVSMIPSPMPSSPAGASMPSATSGKSGKPHKPSSPSSSDSDFSVPRGELLDNFDLDDSGDAASSATMVGGTKGGKSRRRRRRIERRDHRSDHDRQRQSSSTEEEFGYNVFGRRMSRRIETGRIRDTVIADTEDVRVAGSRGGSVKRLKRRLRTMGVSSD